MKIKYINEGFFKNPEQAKAAREKERELSNVEKIAGVSSKIMKEPLIKFINDGFDNYYNSRSCRHSSAYTPQYSDYSRGDYLNAGPNFMSPYCIVKATDVMYMNYAQNGKAFVTDLDLDNNTIDITIVIGTPIAGRSYGIQSVKSNEFVAYASYFDNICGICNMEKGLYDKRCAVPGAYKKFLASKLSQLFIPDLLEDLERDKDSEYSKKLLEIIDTLNFVNRKLEYNIKVEWNLQEDVIIFPVFSRNAADLNGARGTGVEGLEYIHDFIYPNLKFTTSLNEYKERYGTDYITPDSLVKSMHLLLGNTYSVTVTTVNMTDNVHSIEDMVELYKKSIENLGIEITGPGHLYLSVGYFKKDYLIA